LLRCSDAPAAATTSADYTARNRVRLHMPFVRFVLP